MQYKGERNIELKIFDKILQSSLYKHYNFFYIAIKQKE